MHYFFFTPVFPFLRFLKIPLSTVRATEEKLQPNLLIVPLTLGRLGVALNIDLKEIARTRIIQTWLEGGQGF